MSGYLGLLDVLGFSALITSDTSNDRAHRYLDSLREVTESTPVNYVVFSYSIILTLEDDQAEAWATIAAACSQVAYQLLMQDIPTRGAISYGQFLRSTIGQSVFVAGRAVIEAYQFEQAQDWIGIMLAPSAVRHVPELPTQCALDHITQFADVKDRINWASYVQPCHAI